MVNALVSLPVRKLSTADSSVGRLGKNLSGDLKEIDEAELPKAFKDGRRRTESVRGVVLGKVAVTTTFFSVSEAPSYWVVRNENFRILKAG